MIREKPMQNTEAKGKIFYRKHSLNCGGRLLRIERPLIMAILNITPDSFYDGGRYMHEDTSRDRIQHMISEGADIIDIGASSTRPGAQAVSVAEEIQRLRPVLQLMQKEFPDAIVSVDTYQSEVARAAADMGAHIINDISGGTMDKEMFATMGELKIPYVLMHIQGTPATMQSNPQYKDVFKEVCYFFSLQIQRLLEKGVNDIILDPGFGFGKTVIHNYELLEKFDGFKIFDRPLLAGMSRKRMINEVLGTKAEDALNGTTVVNTMALQKGADILRVHDVKEAREAAKIVTFTQNI